MNPRYNVVVGETDDVDNFETDDQVLADALAKALQLAAKLERQRIEIEQARATLSPEKLALGKMAFENALASANRLRKALEEAIVIRGTEDISHHDN